jgi:glycosyltransferase involved in cell wall biosynthesis
MKAFFLVNEFSGGGAEKMVNNLARGFVQYGVSTYIIVLHSEIELPAVIDGVHVRVLYRGNSPSGIRKFLSLISLSQKLKEVLKDCRYNPKVDLFTSHLPFSNYVAWLASVKDHFAVIHSTYSKLYTKRWLYPILSLIHSRKQLIFVSAGIQLDFLENFKIDATDTYQIYNPFDFKQIREASEAYPNPIEGRYVIHIGRFSPEKRHDLLLDAFSRLNDRDVRLLLVGDGEMHDEILRKIKSCGLEDRVIFTGWIDNPYPYLKGAEVLVLSSDFEGLPSVLIEAMAVSTPVVSTACPSGPSEILKGNLSDFLSPPGDPIRLCSNIETALKNYPSISEELLGKFAIGHVVKEYIKLKEYKN